MSTLILDKPILGPCSIDLRPYQDKAINAVRNEFVKGVKSTMIVVGTGLGKTIIFGMIARRAIEKGGRVLVLAHTEELISQAVNKLDMLGVEVGIEKAEQKARAIFDPDAVIASVQTMKPKRLSTWDPNYFTLVIVDECHHAVCTSYQRILRHFKSARVLGVTATADRSDEESLGQVFDSVAFEMNLWDGMTDPDGPYLSQLRFVQCDVDIDLRSLNVKGDDYTEEDLEAIIGPKIEVLANATRQEAGDRKTLIFVPQRVKLAQAAATAMQSMGLRAEWVSGDDQDRKQKIQDFRDGKLQYLANCNVLTEGVDVPEVAAIGLWRPTKSRSLYSQQVGRGVRLSPGKEDCLLIDFNYLTAKHDLVKPVDLMDKSTCDDEMLTIAQEMILQDKNTTLVQAIERAKTESEQRKVLRIKAREREIKYRRVSYNPLDVCDTMGLPNRASKSPDAIIHKATPGQVKFLTNCFGVENADQLSRTRAKTMIDFLKNRMDRGLATMKQVSWCIAKGVPPEVARAMSKQEASQKLDEFFKKKGA
jgi:superfamily II DNA or RNA helicase